MEIGHGAHKNTETMWLALFSPQGQCMCKWHTQPLTMFRALLLTPSTNRVTIGKPRSCQAINIKRKIRPKSQKRASNSEQ